jgi:hypothetical protein
MSKKELHITSINKSQIDNYIGFLITTNKEEEKLFLGIENTELCCEIFDASLHIEYFNQNDNEFYIVYEDDLTSTNEVNNIKIFSYDLFKKESLLHLIGVDILKVEFDMDKRYKNDISIERYQTSLSITTSLGLITLIVFNDHSGNYSHNYICYYGNKQVIGEL